MDLIYRDLLTFCFWPFAVSSSSCVIMLILLKNLSAAESLFMTGTSMNDLDYFEPKSGLLVFDFVCLLMFQFSLHLSVFL